MVVESLMVGFKKNQSTAVIMLKMEHILLVILFSMCCHVIATGQEDEGESRVRRSRNRNRGSNNGAAFDNIDVGHLPIGLQRGIQGMVMNRENLASYTPAPVSAEDAECQVGVKQTTYHNGRCIRLGNAQRPACQAGRHLDIYNGECIRQASEERTISFRHERGNFLIDVA
ncbi:hypothetical protein LOTGIDRAFT_229257 [Lottia gigantea]|uniref:Uncharacterized protein n=1 Tax=Lottia gigantea TaxID=225164 RepID=V3ZRW3_LOTGI|nr:hypothetical protein LOTGIDRAFT_229257 [Lottia gigantea]ESO87087.1 hypothetical protein LOTGIDRAFT_229257 [Lottia gigantea]